MKDVGTAARFRQSLLVTGFGAFPGAPRNPTLAILAGLERHRSRLARLGIELRCAVLPVVFEAVEPALRAAIGDARPDAIVHLGLAGRRRTLSIETRAINRAGPLHPDAARARPAQLLVRGGAQALRATYPAARIRAALARAGMTRVSRSMPATTCAMRHFTGRSPPGWRRGSASSTCRGRKSGDRFDEDATSGRASRP